MPTQWSLTLPNTETCTTTAIRRSIHHETFDPSSTTCRSQTLYHAIRRGLELNPKGSCLGHRVTLDNNEVTPFLYLTYEQVVGKIDAVAAGLSDWNLMNRNEDGFLLVCVHHSFLRFSLSKNTG